MYWRAHKTATLNSIQHTVMGGTVCLNGVLHAQEMSVQNPISIHSGVGFGSTVSKNVAYLIYGWPLIDKYMVAHERLCEYIKANENEGLNLHCQCYGNFTVFVGDQDQFIHIWKFRDGYSTLDNEKKAMESNSEYK